MKRPFAACLNEGRRDATLRLIAGRSAPSGTEEILSEIKRRAGEGESGLILLVPEQFSHEAERGLCAACDDSASLHAEVLSFSLLAARVFALSGGLADSVLDDGGRLLVLLSALRAVEGSLKAFRPFTRRPEFLSGLLRSVDELKTCRVSAERLCRAAEVSGGALGEKLGDLSLILGAYEAITARGSFDPRDRLDKLRDDLISTKFGKGKRLYIDHFTDFTFQELSILEALLKNGADLTVSLCCDDVFDPEGEDAFDVTRLTASRFIRMAAENGAECSILGPQTAREERAAALSFVSEHVFTAESPERDFDNCDAVLLYTCPDPASECRLAAAAARRLVREKGYRWRDIAVAANGFEGYEALAEGVFSDYGVPVYLSRKTDLLQKPLPALALSALFAAESGFAYADMFRYLKTGLAGLDRGECDILENYVLKWNIRGSLWTRDEPWTLHPRGFAEELDGEDAALLSRIDGLRRRAAAPLKELAARGRQARTARDQTLALYDFLEGLGAAEKLQARAERFAAGGEPERADEYVQLWDIFTGCLEQCAAILGDAPMEQPEFAKLLGIILSQYDVGTIPVSLDRVSVGELERVLVRPVKCLILMGATGDSLPRSRQEQDLLSESDREELLRQGLELSGGEGDALSRELHLIYRGVALPSEKLIVTRPAAGEHSQPSFLVGRIKLLLGLEETEYESVEREVSAEAPLPALELAAMEPESGYGRAAAEYLRGDPELSGRLEAVLRAASLPRGALSPGSVAGLYGKKVSMTASRVDKFSSCRFAYFLQYGLKARPRKKAELDAPEIGTFLHFVLESVARETKALGGFSAVGGDRIRAMTEKYVRSYADTRLGGLENKTSRFRYLFGRLVKSVHSIVADMAEELRRSDFEPLDFELVFGEGGDLPPVATSSGGMEMTVSGIADRVDGWLHGGRLYLRVVDYKTGKKSFDLSDIWYGMGMQMLMYLFMLQEEGEGRYGAPIVPAGVLYAPARDVLLSAPRRAGPEYVRAERVKALRRSGLILGDPGVIEAMENGGEPEYIPVKFKKDGSASGSIATLEQLGSLRRHIEKTLSDVVSELKSGEVPADPWEQGGATACDFCDFAAACHFDERAGDCPRPRRHLRAAEAMDYISKEAQGE